MTNSVNRQSQPVESLRPKRREFSCAKLNPGLAEWTKYVRQATILDLGCGSGELAHALLELGAEKVTLLDPSYFNLLNAKSLLFEQNSKLNFIRRDLTDKWNVGVHCYDLIVSEVKFCGFANVNRPFREAATALKRGGKLIFVSGNLPERGVSYFTAAERNGFVIKQMTLAGVEPGTLVIAERI